MVQVVAVLLWQEDKFLICQRPAEKARGLLWEFVGGKVEPGETREQALIRECEEELAVRIRVGPLIGEVRHEYPDITVNLILYHGIIQEGELQLLEHRDIQWISPEQIPEYQFCPADESFLQALLQGDILPWAPDKE